MPNFFKKNSLKCPIDEETRIWMENAVLWMITKFSEPRLLAVRTYTPTEEDLPFDFTGDEKVVWSIAAIICQQMDLNPDDITIGFFDQITLEVNTGSGHTIFAQPMENERYICGRYNGIDSFGKHSISLESGQLMDPEKLVATLAHELSHVKILGSGLLKENDEYLTELFTVFFGFGIFSANAAFRFFKTQNAWGYNAQGYFTQQEWGYALALYSYVHYQADPEWMKHLTPNILSDFKKGQSFILENQDKILR